MEDSNHSDANRDRSERGVLDTTLPDRRIADRHRTVCRIARVSRKTDVGLWRVRNISDDGLMLAADGPTTIGENLEIALSETVILSGCIVWVDEGHCGVAFSSKIDVREVLRTLAEEQRTEGYRALRLAIEAEAILVLPDGAMPIDLVNISQSGAGFRFDGVIDPETEVELLLPGSELKRRALVRWSSGGRGGLWFTERLDRAELESIVRFQRKADKSPLH